METKRRQRLARKKRKKEEKQLLRKSLVKLIEEMKEVNKCLSNKVQVEMAIKDKYFAMWRASEKEKEKFEKRWAEVFQIYPNAIHFNPLQFCPSTSLFVFPVFCSSSSIVLRRYFDI